MTEDEARGWAAERVSPSAFAKLERFAALLRNGAATQNLVATSTLDSVWARHIVDSLQLLEFAPGHGHWVDIGSGAGLPGIVIAIAGGHRVTMIEPRRLRVEFLRHCIRELQLERAVAIQSRAETAKAAPADVISARAVAALPALLGAAGHLARSTTTWVLPKGRGATNEVAAARRSWHGVFHVKHSVVDPESGIIVARQVAAR